MNPSQFVCTPTEIKLLLRLRQLQNQGLVTQVLIDLPSITLHVIGKPENLERKEASQRTLLTADQDCSII